MFGTFTLTFPDKKDEPPTSLTQRFAEARAFVGEGWTITKMSAPEWTGDHITVKGSVSRVE